MYYKFAIDKDLCLKTLKMMYLSFLLPYVAWVMTLPSAYKWQDFLGKVWLLFQPSILLFHQSRHFYKAILQFLTQDLSVLGLIPLNADIRKIPKTEIIK